MHQSIYNRSNGHHDKKMCYTVLPTNQTEKCQLLTCPMPICVTYTDRDNMIIFDSDMNSGLASGA